MKERKSIWDEDKLSVNMVIKTGMSKVRPNTEACPMNTRIKHCVEIHQNMFERVLMKTILTSSWRRYICIHFWIS